MAGEIWIIHSAWTKSRIERELLADLKNPVGELAKELANKGVNKDQALAVLRYIGRYGSHLVEGDVHAKAHILGTLRCLYDPTRIHEINSWTLGQNSDEISAHEMFKHIREQHVILIGGPTGNPATNAFMDHTDIRWLFPRERGASHAILRWKGDSEMLRPEGYPPETLRSDYGVFLRTSNPFAAPKRLYAVMGAYAWGTQAAGALACVGPSASEVLLTKQCRELAGIPVDFCAWVRVWHGGGDAGVLSTFDDPECCFQIVWPKPLPGREWQVYTNPRSINRTLDALKAFVAARRSRQQFIIPPRVRQVLGLAGSVSAFTFALLALVWKEWPSVITIPGIVVSALSALKFFLHLWPVTVDVRDSVQES